MRSRLRVERGVGEEERQSERREKSEMGGMGQREEMERAE